jgi:hypothetical protein
LNLEEEEEMEGLLKKKRFLLAQNFKPKKISKPNFCSSKKKKCVGAADDDLLLHLVV